MLLQQKLCDYQLTKCKRNSKPEKNGSKSNFELRVMLNHEYTEQKI
jgi:hypothetical protein